MTDAIKLIIMYCHETNTYMPNDIEFSLPLANGLQRVIQRIV